MLYTPERFKKILQKKGQASDLTLDQAPLLKNSETSHLFLTGTTGSGKTNAFHTLLPQLRKRPNRAVIVNLTGDYVMRYYREGRDILLNPYDQRSKGWSPWEEYQNEAHYDALVAAMVPPSRDLDDFWSQAGKKVLKAALKKLKERRQAFPDALYQLLATADFQTFSKFFKGTEGVPFTEKEGEKLTHSIRATLVANIDFLNLLGAFQETFSMRQWIEDPGEEDQWVFLCARVDQRESLRPLYSALIDTGITALMSLPPDSHRRVWFIMDELPALNRLPSLERGLAELRKYGGCLMCGVQSVSQLETTYSPSSARTLLGLFNTKIFFRSLDPTTGQWMSRSIGEAEVSEHIENVFYGANTIRDGVSLNQTTRTRPLVLPTELANLESLHCYLKVAGNFPVTKIEMTYKEMTDGVSPFHPLSPKADQGLEIKVS